RRRRLRPGGARGRRAGLRAGPPAAAGAIRRGPRRAGHREPLRAARWQPGRGRHRGLPGRQPARARAGDRGDADREEPAMTCPAPRGLPAALLIVLATAAPVAAHTGGSNGYAVVSVEEDRVRYELTLWPTALPPAIGERIGRARAGDT